MANNARNRAKRKKLDASKKPESNHKDNLVKKVKVNKLSNNGSIALSKRLMSKDKTAQPNISARRHYNVVKKVCGNGKPMPTLEDLEKMFEDSSEEDDAIMVETPSTWQPTTSKPNTNLDNELIKFSNEDISPSSKKLIEIDTCNILHEVLSTKPSPDISESMKKNPKNEQTQSTRELDASENDDELNNNTKLLTVMEENIDCNSSDSNKTIDYNLSKNITFCPLPSTSNDNNTIIKNDKLFYESLKQAPINNDNNTIIKNDKLFYESLKQAPINNNDIITNESDLGKKSIDNANDKKGMFDIDDDCIIVDSDINISKQTVFDTDSMNQKFNSTDTPKLNNNNLEKKDIVTDTIDLVDNLYTDSPVEMEDEIIDIDALIDDNQSMLAKYQNSLTNKKSDDSLVIDVSPECVKQSNAPEQNQIHSIPTSTPENNEHDVLFVSETVPKHSRNNEIRQLNRDNQCEIGDTQPSSLQDLTNSRVLINNQKQRSRSDVENYLLLDFIHQCKKHILLTEGLPVCVINLPSNSLSPSLTTTSHRDSTNANDPVHSRNNQHKTNSPKKTIAKISSDSRTNNDSSSPSRKIGDCPICMDTFLGKTIASTICGHVFCMSCLEKSVKTNNRCPTCRKILKKKGSYHQIYI